MIQLDGLRALAVLAVLLSHFGASGNLIVRSLPWGAMGVRLFFVLSGFLITGILLRCREQLGAGQAPARQILGKFYARRFLRIFPVYYAVLFAITLVNIRPTRDLFWWHLTYTSNFHYALQGDFQGPGSHFWSLAVEEQFYLVWPWLTLFTPRRWLVPLNVSIIALAVGFRSFGVLLGWNALALQILPFGCLDSLGMGSLLAVFTSGGRTWPQHASRFANISFWGGLSLSAFLALGSKLTWGHRLNVALEVWGMALVFVALVAWGALGMGGLVGKFLALRPLVYIGKISYGIYLYHGFVPVVGPRLFGYFGGHAFYQQFDGLVNTTMTILLAAASWQLFEGPINRFKERFSYLNECENLTARGHSPAGSAVLKDA